MPKASFSVAMTAMGNASERLERDLETHTIREMGILVRPGADQDGSLATEELERALGTNETVRSYGYRIQVDAADHPWVLLRAGSLRDLMSSAASAGETLTGSGMGERVLAAVLPFAWRDRRVYWLYQPRVRAFTPFVPNGQSEEDERDHETEMRMAKGMEKHIPIEKDLGEWYPVWDRPF